MTPLEQHLEKINLRLEEIAKNKASAESQLYSDFSGNTDRIMAYNEEAQVLTRILAYINTEKTVDFLKNELVNFRQELKKAKEFIEELAKVNIDESENPSKYLVPLEAAESDARVFGSLISQITTLIKLL